MSEKKKAFKDMTLRERFKSRGFGLVAWADAKGVCRVTVGNVLDGKWNGSRNQKNSKTREIILLLRADGIWIEPLTWTEENEKESA